MKLTKLKLREIIREEILKEREPSYENRNLTDLLRNMTTTLSLFETMIHRGTGRDDVAKFIRKRVSPLLTKLVKEIKKV
jgi:hypothetical protein